VWGEAGSGGSGGPLDSGYVSVYAGEYDFIAMKAEGELFGWGYYCGDCGGGAPGGTVPVFKHNFTLVDVMGSYGCCIEASLCVM
jgi:hypothetical protein